MDKEHPRLMPGFDPSITGPPSVIPETVALAKWYDAHPEILRLWGISDEQALRVVLLIEPVLDSDDIYPVWIANSRPWARELGSLTKRAVQLELFDESSLAGIRTRAENIVIAELCWRDATLVSPNVADQRTGRFGSHDVLPYC